MPSIPCRVEHPGILDTQVTVDGPHNFSRFFYYSGTIASKRTIFLCILYTLYMEQSKLTLPYSTLKVHIDTGIKMLFDHDSTENTA